MTVTINGVAPTQVQQASFWGAMRLAPVFNSQGGRPLRVAFAGDSIAASNASRTGQSGFCWAASEFLKFEYETVLNSAVGGTAVSHLITNQIAQLEALADKPDVVVVNSIQNNFIGSQLDADSAYGFMKEYAERALAAGVKLVVLASRPPKTSGDSAHWVAYLNRRLDNLARTTNGIFYWDVFSLWKATSGAETNPLWRLTGNVPFTTSGDGTHPSANAWREAGRILAPALEKLVVPMSPIPAVSAAYSDTTAPFNNLLGVNGTLTGNSGTLNGSPNSGVAGNSTSTRDFWAVTTNNGITVIPTIVTGADGYRYQQFELSGTATADALVTMSFDYVFDVSSGPFVGEAMVETENVVGISGLRWAASGLTVVEMTGLNGLDFGTTSLHLRTPIGTLSNGGFSTRTNTFRISVLNGKTVSGTVRVGRLGIYRLPTP